MDNYSLFLVFLSMSAVKGVAVYQGCYQLSGNPPNQPIATTTLGSNLSVNSCMNVAIFNGTTAFGMRIAGDNSQYCFTGPLSAFIANGNLTANASTYCNGVCPGDNSKCGGSRVQIGNTNNYIYAAVVYTIVNAPVCINTTWSAWSACSQTCDQGVQNRFRILNNGTGCNSSKLFAYQSCGDRGTCHPSTTHGASLQTICKGLNGYYAYSTCYFVSNSSGTGASVCAKQNSTLASLFGFDLIPQLGSYFLTTSSVFSLTSLQYNSGGLNWVSNGINYPYQSNYTIVPPTQSCVSLISNINSTGNSAELPHLNYTECNSSLNRPICMKTDHVYSSYSGIVGSLITEQQSPEPLSYELDAHACGARCSRIIGCQGFNYRSVDKKCIPTKVSYYTPSTISGIQLHSIQTDPDNTFYNRI